MLHCKLKLAQAFKFFSCRADPDANHSLVPEPQRHGNC